MTTDYIVEFRGFPACPCLAEWLPAYEHLLQVKGVLVGPLHIYQLIGGAPKSGGTHTDGGAADLLDLPGELDWELARAMGADSSWSRPYNWDSDGGMAHFHLVLRGCPHNGPARYQITAVDDGYNGLGYLGRQAPDNGPRPLSGRTWREGIRWALQQEDDMFSEDDRALLKKIARGQDTFRANERARDKALREKLKKIDGELGAIADISSSTATKTQVAKVRKDLAALADHEETTT